MRSDLFKKSSSCAMQAVTAAAMLLVVACGQGTSDNGTTLVPALTTLPQTAPVAKEPEPATRQDPDAQTPASPVPSQDPNGNTTPAPTQPPATPATPAPSQASLFAVYTGGGTTLYGAGLSGQYCIAALRLRSLDSKDARQVAVVNRSGVYVNLSWLDTEGKLKNVRTMPPNTRITLTTSAGHAFILSEVTQTTATCAGVFSVK